MPEEKSSNNEETNRQAQAELTLRPIMKLWVSRKGLSSDPEGARRSRKPENRCYRRKICQGHKKKADYQKNRSYHPGMRKKVLTLRYEILVEGRSFFQVV